MNAMLSHTTKKKSKFQVCIFN